MQALRRLIRRSLIPHSPPPLNAEVQLGGDERKGDEGLGVGRVGEGAAVVTMVTDTDETRSTPSQLRHACEGAKWLIRVKECVPKVRTY